MQPSKHLSPIVGGLFCGFVMQYCRKVEELVVAGGVWMVYIDYHPILMWYNNVKLLSCVHLLFAGVGNHRHG